MRKLTQAELAERIGLSTQAVSFLEQGRKKPSLESLSALSRELHVSTDHILKGEASPSALSPPAPDVPLWAQAMQAELNAKLDAICAHFRIVVEPASARPRPNRAASTRRIPGRDVPHETVLGDASQEEALP